MELQEAICNRQSTRKFSNKTINHETIHEMIKLAHRAPSAGNLQARDFIIVDDDAVKKQLSTAAFHQQFISEAPVVIVVCSNLQRISPYGTRGVDLYCLQDAAAAVEHLLLLAVEQGLGSCWVGAFREQDVSRLLHLPSFARPVALIALGYPNEAPASTSRINSKQIIHYNRW